MEKYVTVEEYRDMFAKMRELMKQATGPPPQYIVDGINLPPMMAKAAREIKTFEVREDDVWIVTYPKAGTTWAQEIVSCVMHDGNLEEVNKRHTSFRVLFLDLELPEPIRRAKNLPPPVKIAEEIPSPRVLKSHLPGPLLPPQIWEKKPKIVYVIRNPKDLTVSRFYFKKMVIPTPEMLAQTFEEFVETTNSETVDYGPWWDHYLYFWQRRHEPNILLLQFEDLKRDLRGNVDKISQFLGKDLSAEKLDDITEHCTFANMKKNPMANQEYVMSGKSGSFMRKGKVGDWKSHFTVAQNEAMDALIREKFNGTGLTFDNN